MPDQFDQRGEHIRRVTEAAAQEQGEGRPPEFSDIALASRCVQQMVLGWRYVARWGWMHWTGSVWRDEQTLRAFDTARKLCKTAAADVLDRDDLSESARRRISNGIASASTVAAVERLAKAYRELAGETSDWDADLWLLNTPKGAVNLRTGELRNNDWADFATKQTSVAPEFEPPQLWLEFLDRVTASDVDLQAYLQRLAGYCLTGETREHSLHFFWGTGANGKSTFLNVLRAALGSYAEVAAPDTFIETRTDRHPTELAMLRASRMVLTTETEDGRQWHTSRIKALSGGDPYTARHMRQDFFTFTPAFKILIAGNHRPGMRNVDEAMRRRMHLIPFTVTIPPAERDQHLHEKLLAELPQILGWAVEGCLRWQREGLQAPAAVIAATQAYLEDQDTIGAWLDEYTVRDAEAWETTAALVASYRAYAEKTGERFLGARKLAAAIEARGYLRHRTSSAKGFEGVRIVNPGELHSAE